MINTIGLCYFTIDLGQHSPAVYRGVRWVELDQRVYIHRHNYTRAAVNFVSHNTARPLQTAQFLNLLPLVKGSFTPDAAPHARLRTAPHGTAMQYNSLMLHRIRCEWTFISLARLRRHLVGV